MKKKLSRIVRLKRSARRKRRKRMRLEAEEKAKTQPVVEAPTPPPTPEKAPIKNVSFWKKARAWFK